MKALVAAAWVISQVPCTLSSITVRKPFGVIASAGLRNWPPALLTSRSRRPWRSSRPSTSRSTSCSSRMSAASASTEPASSAAAAAVSSSGSGRRPQPTTVAPSRASSSAVARPSPLPAPDTRQTRPASNPGTKMREGSLSAIGGPAYPRTGQRYADAAQMRIHAEPKPLHEPLSGGKPGATVVVEPLVAGHVSWPKDLMESPGGRFLTMRLSRALFSRKNRWMVPCPAFLIHHPGAGPILVDTGLHPSIASDPRQNFGRLALRVAPPTLEQGEDVPAQLRKRGVDPSKVGVVLMTHLHYDHASAISEFPDSTFVISEAEWDDATSGGRPAVRGYRPAHYDCVFDYRTIDFDRGKISSYASFGRTFDVFGDGSVRLAYTPGHTAGHMCVVARLRERDFVIGGDAVYTYRQLEGDAPPPPRPFDAHNWRRSLQELKLFRSQFPHAIITPGHDTSFYEQLEAQYT